MEPTSKQLLAALLEAHKSNVDAVPPGYKTRVEWQKEWNCSPSHAKNLLNAGLAKGLIVVKRLRVMRENGVCSIPHYAPSTVGNKAKKA